MIRGRGRFRFENNRRKSFPSLFPFTPRSSSSREFSPVQSFSPPLVTQVFRRLLLYVRRNRVSSRRRQICFATDGGTSIDDSPLRGDRIRLRSSSSSDNDALTLGRLKVADSRKRKCSSWRDTRGEKEKEEGRIRLNESTSEGGNENEDKKDGALRRLGPYISSLYIFSPYCTLFADNHERRSVPGRQGDGYFSGWKIIRRLPQALKWAALRLRTIIIISSDEEGAVRQPWKKGNAKGKSGRGRGRGGRGRSPPSPGYRLARIHSVPSVPMW